MTGLINTKMIRHDYEFFCHLGQHWEGCWQAHSDCLIIKMCDEIDQLRQERTMLLLQRDEMLKRMKRGSDNVDK